MDGDGGGPVSRGIGKRAGRKPAFTEQDVVAAVLEEGVDRFTLAGIAKRLGVVTAALYRLYDSREAIVVATLDHIAATFRVPDEGSDWRAVLRLWADECWRLCEGYPGLSRVVYSYAPAFTRIEHVISAYAECLAATGKTAKQAMFALDFIGDTVFASYLGAESWRTRNSDGVSGFEQVKGVVDRGSIIEPRETWLERGVVDTKVEFILAGLEHSWPEI
ncbi:TetR/AcrR family transcriptional regulator [Gordonia sp. NPDC127522]|uniref:TetR/AcrR family transcriptional regulator n=1 Tax=Gordonia sp. NPDC127522 TaxID=3345390 RepID=UPI003640CDBA